MDRHRLTWTDGINESSVSWTRKISKTKIWIMTDMDQHRLIWTNMDHHTVDDKHMDSKYEIRTDMDRYGLACTDRINESII